MTLPSALAAALLASLVAQTAGAGTTASTVPGEGEAEVPLSSDRFAEPVETGIPLLPSTAPPAKAVEGRSLDLGVMSLFRAWTLGTTGPGSWALDLEITPGASINVATQDLRFAAGYAARLTIPVDATGATFAALQRAYARVEWASSPTWTWKATGGFTYGQFSQLVPVTTPGAPGVPPSTVTPVRSFQTYPYIGADGSLSAKVLLSPRGTLRLSLAYTDVGGIGSEGQVAQPRTWGPTAEAAFDWELSRLAMLTSSLTFADSFLVGGFSIALGTWRESWTQRWLPDLETILSAGAALTSTDTVVFAGVGHLMPVASASVRYFTDARHAFRLWGDVSLAPYVDTYIASTYQRLTGSLGVDWYPARGWFAGFFVGGGLSPAAAPPPQGFGTAGVSASWSPSTWLTLSAGAFTQFQGTGYGPTPLPAFSQWNTFVSLTLGDALAL